MKVVYSTIKSGLGLFVIAVLLGCMEKPITESYPAIKTIQPTKAAKPGAAIKLISDTLISIAPNELFHTVIVLETTESSGELVIEFSPTQGLNLESLSTPQTIKFAKSSPIKIPVVLTAIGNGRYYLNMHVRFNNTNAISVRNLALIVQVGPVLDSAVKLQKIAGENVIVLPAQEHISSQ